MHIASSMPKNQLEKCCRGKKRESENTHIHIDGHTIFHFTHQLQLLSLNYLKNCIEKYRVLFCAIILLVDYKLQCSIFSLFQKSSPVFPNKLQPYVSLYNPHKLEYLQKQMYQVPYSSLARTTQLSKCSSSQILDTFYYQFSCFMFTFKWTLKASQESPVKGAELIVFLILKNVHSLCGCQRSFLFTYHLGTIRCEILKKLR